MRCGTNYPFSSDITSAVHTVTTLVLGEALHQADFFDGRPLEISF